MPYPKKRKSRPQESGEFSNKRQHTETNGRPRDMLKTGIRTIRNVAVDAGRSIGSTATLATAASGSSTGGLRSKIDSRSRDSVPRTAPLEASFFARQSDYGGQGRTSQRGSRRERFSNHRRSQVSNNKKEKPTSVPRTPSNIHSEEYIYNNFTVPKASEYGLAAEPIDNCREILAGANLLSTTYSFREPAHTTQFVEKIVIQCELDVGLVITAHGHGRTKGEAERNASFHAICILHHKGLFKDILPGGKYSIPSPSTLQTESNAQKDIVDYAARHGCTPTFVTSQVKSKLAKAKVIKTATASIPELGLSGSGRATNNKDALLHACINLKHAAEALHEQTGDGLLLVKDYTTLTSESARKFTDYYCFQKRLKYEVSHKNEKGRSGIANRWTSTVKVTKFTAGFSEDGIDPTTKPDYHIVTVSGEPMENKKDSEDTALLAVTLPWKKENPAIWNSFVKEMKRGNGEVLKPVRPIDMNLSRHAIETIGQALRDVRHANEESDFNLKELEKASTQSRKRLHASRQLSKEAIQRKNRELKDAFDRYQSDPDLQELRRKRSELPMVQHCGDVMKLVLDNEICVVVGATGSGKTTQLPQLILEEMIGQGNGGNCNIVCTQPRRIAAISVAQRVAVERNEPLQRSIGYAVRFDSKLPNFGGSINYCTTGILLKQLQDSQETTLHGISHIVIDEVHERDIQIDFLLVILRQLLVQRRAAGLPPIKVIMMSATIDTTLFCKYFGAGFETGRCPYIEVPGRTFPVTTHYLDEIHPMLKKEYTKALASELYSRDTMDYVSRELTNPPNLSISAPVTENNSVVVDDDDNKAVINWKSKGVIGDDGEAELALEKEDTVTPVGLMSITIAHILKTTTEGSILVFLPGLQEITALNRLLTTTNPLGIEFSKVDDYKIYMLHSAIPQMQQEVFEKLPKGKRKIILSTNIAETSITIPDVVYVVDSSKQRESQYDQLKRMSSLISTWTSKSNARQRAGRAGRVQHGHYYTMATEARYESFEVAPQPEILRTDLQELCLQIKSMGIKDIGGFLREAIQPPPATSVESSIEHLQALDALDEDQTLTPLGRLLSMLPVQPSLGKMAILGAIFKCVDPILILAAASTAKDPWLSPTDKRNEAEQTKESWGKGTGSDHVATINVFKEWRKLRPLRGSIDRQFAFDNFLHHNTLVTIAQTAEQIYELLQKSGLVAKPSDDRGGRRSFASQYGTEEENRHSDSIALQSALATAGFYPNVAVQTNMYRLVRTAHENAAQISLHSLAAPKSRSSSRYGPIDPRTAHPEGTLFAFAQKTQADQNTVNLRSVTRTSPLAVVLFGGRSTAVGSVLRVDEWIPFFLRGAQMPACTDLSRALDDYLATTFARIGAASRQMLLAQSRGGDNKGGFLSRDQAREPLINGIVNALEEVSPMKPGNQVRDLPLKGERNETPRGLGFGLTSRKLSAAARRDRYV